MFIFMLASNRYLALFLQIIINKHVAAFYLKLPPYCPYVYLQGNNITIIIMKSSETYFKLAHLTVILKTMNIFPTTMIICM